MICSYAKDFQFLRPLLRSLKRFQKGFMPPLVSVQYTDYAGARAIADEEFPAAYVCIKNGPPELGFMRAQISMMSGDLLCPSADYVHLLGSDCVLWDEFTPEQWMKDGKPLMLYTSYSVVGQVPWRAGTERILKFPVEHEFMRRLPLIYPKELFPALRWHIEKVNRLPFEGFIYDQFRAGHRDVSESNLLGAFAFKYRPDLYTWMLTDKGFPKQPHPLVQFWSHGGLDRPAEACVDYRNLKGQMKNSVGQTPRQTMQDIGVL